MMIGRDGRVRNDRQKSQALLYKNAGWNGFADWLGKKKRSEFLPYEEAKKVVNALGLKNRDDCGQMVAYGTTARHPRPSLENL